MEMVLHLKDASYKHSVFRFAQSGSSAGGGELFVPSTGRRQEGCYIHFTFVSASPGRVRSLEAVCGFAVL